MIKGFRLYNKRIAVLILLSLTGFLAHYTSLYSFGFYEDDYYFFAQHIGVNWSEIAKFITDHIISFAQGRPFQYAFSAIITYLFVPDAKSISSLYFIGYLIVVFNSYLVFVLLKYSFPAPIALFGAIVFLIHPADSTKILLTHTYIIQPALTLSLISLIAFPKFNKNYRFIPYTFAFASLLFYESPFILFLFAPFITADKDVKLIKVLQHWGYSLLIIFIILVIRKLIGESRVGIISDFSAVDLFTTILSSLFLGIYGLTRASAYGLLNGFNFVFSSEFSYSLLVLSLIALSISYWFSRNVRNLPIQNVNTLEIRFLVSFYTVRKYIYLIILGIFLLPVSYLFSFTHFPPLAITGRGTSVHFVGVFSSTFLIASLLFYFQNSIVFFKKHPKTKYILSLSIVPFIFIMLFFSMSYNVYLQQQFSKSRSHQIEFWKQFKLLTKDSNDTTIFLTNGANLDNQRVIREIGGADWALPLAYSFFTGADNTFITPMESPGNLKWMERQDSMFVFDNGATNWGKWIYLDLKNTIFLSKNRDDILVRIDSLSINTNVSLINNSENVTSEVKGDSSKNIRVVRFKLLE